METQKSTADAATEQIRKLIETMKQVILGPKAFFRTMPQAGGFKEPLIFLMGMGLFTGLVQLVLAILGLGPSGSLGMAFAAVILTPVFAAIFGFLGAAIAFALWKLMGSARNYETAYRCCAYMAAISPVTTLLQVIPYLGTLAALAWFLYIVVTASVEVHNLKPKQAWIVFGVLFGLLALTSLSARHKARQVEQQLEQWQKQSESLDEMTPEEAGKAMGEFLKGLEKGVKEQ